jgi:rare lipoprotein A
MTTDRDDPVGAAMAAMRSCDCNRGHGRSHSAGVLHRGALLLGALLLSACAGAPKKGEAPSSASRPSQQSGTKRKVSPYAPAQEDPNTRGDYVAGGLYKPGVRDTTPGDIPDVDAIPEPDVVDEPLSRYGNRSPYKVLGKSYTVRGSAKGYLERGQASYYGNKFHGRKTSNHEVYDMYAFTAAHRSLPLPSFARVTNLDNGSSVVVRVNDRGPFHDGRVIDLSYAAAVKLGIHPRGTGRVEVRGLSAGENARLDRDAVASRPDVDPKTGLPPGVRVATGKPAAVAPSTATTTTTTPAPSAIDTFIEALPIGSASAGERRSDATSIASTTPSTAAASAATAASGGSDLDWRFDMRQDGRAMTADEFDAWMKARRARVATGKAGRPDPYGSAAPGARREVAKATVPKRVPAPSAETAAAAREADSAPEPVQPPASGSERVTLQIAAFGARANADRALGMLRSAGIGDARLQDGTSAGKPIWRLRVGPIDSAGIAELSARVAGLGFGTPHVVRD